VPLSTLKKALRKFAALNDGIAIAGSGFYALIKTNIMKPQHNSLLFPITGQTVNNATGFVGHMPGDDKSISRGQTFILNEEQDIDAIEIFSNIVTRPGHLVMTLYNFDPYQNTWGNPFSSCMVEVGYEDSEKWIEFDFPHIHLEKGRTYGFSLESDDSLVGVGEAAASVEQPPLSSGQEWLFVDDDKHGNAFSYFNLAYKVEARA